MKNFERFLNGEIIYNVVSKEDDNVFRGACKEKGMRIYPARDWWKNKENTCYRYNNIHKAVCILEKIYYQENFSDITIVEFETEDHTVKCINNNPLLKINKDNNSTLSQRVKIHESICNKLTTTYEQKNNDYGNSFSVMRKEYDNAILIRLFDKYSRLKSLKSGITQKVADESVKDTLLDLANYCILELIEMEIENECKWLSGEGNENK